MPSDSSNSTADPLAEMSNWHDAYWATEARWPTSRNDHYCSQDVCRHTMLDLGPPSDSEDDRQMDVDRVPRTSYSLLPRSVRSQQQLKIALSTISQLTHQTLHLRKELDELHTSSAAHYFDLEERFTAHVTRYNELPENHAQLSRKHDHLLAIAMNLCEELGVHAERLVELDFWKMAEQDKYVDTHVQSEMQVGLPSPPSTPVASTGAAKKCRLVLRLPSRPAVDEGDAGEWECVDSAYESEPEERKDGKHEADLRKRKRKSVGIADERKTSLNDASRVIKRAKKCHG